MLKTFYDFKYCIWSIDLSYLKLNTNFDKQLNEQFDVVSSQPFPKETNGNAYSAQMRSLEMYDDFLKYIIPSANPYYEKVTGKKIDAVNRCWANRMHKDSFGSIHTHPNNRKVMNLYYNVPIESSDLVFINPNYWKSEINADLIPENEKLHIKVFEGMCILYDSEIPHGVSIHKSNKTRDAIIIEFSSF